MSSRFDRPDPGLDPDYTDAPEDAPEYFRCLWCGMTCEDDTYYPYCGPLCSVEAERDSPEDEESA